MKGDDTFADSRNEYFRNPSTCSEILTLRLVRSQGLTQVYVLPSLSIAISRNINGQRYFTVKSA